VVERTLRLREALPYREERREGGREEGREGEIVISTSCP
jgi:hypothetical protein